MRILIAVEKYCTRYLDATNIEAAAKKLLQDRINDGYWYDDKETEEAKNAITRKKAWTFLTCRSNLEYEYVNVVVVEEVKED